MADQIETLAKAFSGFGVDEKSIISILGKWHPEEKKSFRKGCPNLFHEDTRDFEKWDQNYIATLEHEFARFKQAIVLWTMHAWERDARLVRDALSKGAQSYDVLVEIACTRTSEELLGARRAYHSLFDHSIEEDVAYHINNSNRKLLVALVSAYRYEGAKVNDAIAKSEAKILADAIKNVERNPIEDDEVVMILSTRSKTHLKAVFAHYKELYGNDIHEDLHDASSLKEAVLCLTSPQIHFAKVLDMALAIGASEITKQGLTRVVVTRADTDMKEIKEQYNDLYGVQLLSKIEELTSGNFKDLLLALIQRSE
ncbi:hypothetical protein MKW94_020082 [Papaver nudicaule]|uniref:Annexin n=1 Tax=Papaver nudicaule TaxID=74823 RepID=A0AA41VLA4_PAPNU|nr:hypothetical protein [Papaver nudicaule]